ncbi:C_GCAxxG_C_C family protein [Sebaldella termitidis]|uniref:C_GCAxxG_C_C family protein n=1 Tax=Sebaldella termitidis (strain ATCC 33386 / NCTC 11300) TaxID=526218 RepID=D1AHD4_SEBTE|nr:C-GCAxxG-C-C family protein [Sebaldella termitidis]ACZ08168.1 C_GCAxxG_C_C family protein [Sebaldella termitidis ATCC 33386]SUI23470.1 C_GCAxxG_C_C family protein [Sebaldella termitidis]
MDKEVSLGNIKKEAEKYYAEGDYYCSEAIVAVIKKYIDNNIPKEAIAMASGFPVGIGGSKCVCGAVSGGIISLGYFFGRSNPKDKQVNKTLELADELQQSFKENHKVLCCRVLTKDMEMGSDVHMKQCIEFTGEIARKTAEIITRELNIKTVE